MALTSLSRINRVERTCLHHEIEGFLALFDMIPVDDDARENNQRQQRACDQHAKTQGQADFRRHGILSPGSGRFGYHATIEWNRSKLPAQSQ